LFANNRRLGDIEKLKVTPKNYSSLHVNKISNSVQKNIMDTTMNDVRSETLNKSIVKGKRKINTPSQEINYPNVKYNTINNSFDVNSILASNKKSSDKKEVRSMSIPKKKVNQSNNPVILQQYKYSVKKSMSHISEAILGKKSAGKMRGILRSGSTRRRCENCAKLLAKGFSTVNCACHKV